MSKPQRDRAEMDIWNEYEGKVGTLFSETSSIVTKKQGFYVYMAGFWISSDKTVSVLKSGAVLSF